MKLPPRPQLTNNFMKLPPNLQHHSLYENEYVVWVIGSVNGLICYSHNKRYKPRYNTSSIHIWNPSLSAVLNLPPYSKPYDSSEIYFRFGYDPKTDDYKVVKLTGLLANHPSRGIGWWMETEIYSMRKGTWELITERFPSHITSTRDYDYVCADGHDGHLHWICQVSHQSANKTIVAFDLGSETFREIPLPVPTLEYDSDYEEDAYIRDYQIRANVLGVLAGRLCVVSKRWDSTYEVWVMDEYGVAESWVKHHVISQFNYQPLPLGFTSHDESLFEHDGIIYLQDVIANKETVLDKYWSELIGPYKIVEYVDSLVWIAPEKQV